MSSGSLPPPGWYPDPSVPGTERWWDGTGWTVQVRAAGGPAAPPPPPPPPAASAAGGAGRSPAGFDDGWAAGGAAGGDRPGAGAGAASGAGAGAAGSSQPAGWYADPGAPGMVRWWSGWSWVGEPRLPSEIGATGRGLRDVGELVTDAWTPIGRRLGDLAAMATMVLVPLLLVVGPLVWVLLRDVELVETGWQTSFGTTTSGMQQQYELVGLGGGEVVLLVALGFVALLVSALLWLGSARLLLGEIQGVHEPWGRALRLGAARFWRAAGAAIAMGALLFVAGLGGGILVGVSAIVPPLLLLTVPAWVIGLLYLAFRLQLAPVVAVIAPDDVRPLSATWEHVGSRLLGVVGRLFVLGIITSVAGFAVSIPAGILQAVLPPIAGIAASTVLQVVVQAVASVYILSGSILIWQDLGGAVEQIEPPAPGPVNDGPIAR